MNSLYAAFVGEKEVVYFKESLLSALFLIISPVSIFTQVEIQYKGISKTMPLYFS